jgi:hypothetical protein
MTELYVFRGTTGRAEMVTDDKSGKKLPPHSFGEWVFSRTINVAGETHLVGRVNCAQVLANVVKDGFHIGRNSSLTSRLAAVTTFIVMTFWRA